MRDGAYDVAIAGGGPAGAAAAIVLARVGWRVLLADTGGTHRPGATSFKVGEGLPPSARHLLRELGALDYVLADGHRVSHGTLAFWGSDAPHANDFMFQLHGEGLQLDRRRFDASLLALAEDAGADIVRDAKLSLAVQADGADIHRLTLRSNDVGALVESRIVESRWLIDASGRPATLARALGATRIQHDALLAFHMRLAADDDSDRDGRTWVEAVDNGWWYSVLLPSQERLVAFLCDADLIDRRPLLTRVGLWSALAQAPRLFAYCHAHGHVPSSQPRGADACSSHLDRAASDAGRWLAVGDAALAFDPLSSKGISNALYTGLRGAQAIIECGNGDTDALSHYADHLLDIHRVYREQLIAFYGMEQRWPTSDFWKRRAADSVELLAAPAAQASQAVEKQPAECG
ncbi:MAG: tryptophan 7-halogenase [Pseudomonadota bacterium]